MGSSADGFQSPKGSLGGRVHQTCFLKSQNKPKHDSFTYLLLIGKSLYFVTLRPKDKTPFPMG